MSSPTACEDWTRLLLWAELHFVCGSSLPCPVCGCGCGCREWQRVIQCDSVQFHCDRRTETERDEELPLRDGDCGNEPIKCRHSREHSVFFCSVLFFGSHHSFSHSFIHLSFHSTLLHSPLPHLNPPASTHHPPSLILASRAKHPSPNSCHNLLISG